MSYKLVQNTYMLTKDKKNAIRYYYYWMKSGFFTVKDISCIYAFGICCTLPLKIYLKITLL